MIANIVEILLANSSRVHIIVHILYKSAPGRKGCVRRLRVSSIKVIIVAGIMLLKGHLGHGRERDARDIPAIGPAWEGAASANIEQPFVLRVFPSVQRDCSRRLVTIYISCIYSGNTIRSSKEITVGKRRIKQSLVASCPAAISPQRGGEFQWRRHNPFNTRW